MSFPKLPDVFAAALSARGYSDATPVQSAVLAPETEGRDLLVSAQTGSGKTVAYGLAMAASLMDGEALPPAGAPLALIIAPTRELALQVQEELTWLYAGTRARVTACVGGMDPFRERRMLERGVHIVVGTPGRIRDHMERGALRLEELKVVVLDEADEMLDLGFHDDMEFILKATPQERRTFLFSATLPRPIIALARNFQRDALRIEVASAGGHADIEYRAIRIAHAKVGRTVINLLRSIDPPCALVFCATRLAVQRLGETLASRGFSSVALSGEMSQNERNRALTALREGRAKVCVATDVAARGIDVPHLTLVIHADLPNDAAVLQHRSGRTGRAGRKGVSILLVPPSRRRSAEEMMHRAKVQYVWTDPPSPEEIFAADRERLLESPLFSEPGDSEDVALAKALAGRYSPVDVALALARLYRARLPQPEDLDEYVEDPRAAARRAREEEFGGPREPRGAKGPRQKREKRTDESWSRTPRPEKGGYEKKRSRGDDTHALGEGSVWFRIGVGRTRNADPNWLLPEICRQGEVTKKDIGEIRIYDNETRFELGAAAAEGFAVKVAEHKKGGVNIYPAFGGEPDNSYFPEAEEKPRRHRKAAETSYPPPAALSDAELSGEGLDGWAEIPSEPRTHKKKYKTEGAPGRKPKGTGKAKPAKGAVKGKGARSFTPPDPDRKQKRKERKKAKRQLAAIKD